VIEAYVTPADRIKIPNDDVYQLTIAANMTEDIHPTII